MNSPVLVHWLRAMAKGMPHGGKKIIAEKLGLSQSGVSKLLNNFERGFDEKTLAALSWCENSKAAKFPKKDFPLVTEEKVGPLMIETRQNAKGDKFQVWRTL